MFHFNIDPKPYIEVNRRIERILPLLTPTGVVLGILAGAFLPFTQEPHDSWITPLVTVLFGFMTFSGALSMSVKDFGAIVRKPKNSIITFIGTHIILPFLFYHIAFFFFPSQPDIPLGFLLLFSCPTGVVSHVWAGIYGGYGPLSLTIIIIDTLLAPLVVPLSVSLISGTSITIDAMGMMQSLFWMVAFPAVLGMVVNQASQGKVAKTVQPVSKPFAKLALLLVVILNTSRIAPEILAMTAGDIPIILMAIGLVAISFPLARFMAHLSGIRELPRAVSVTCGMSIRNISAALVLAIEFFPPRSAIPVIAGILIQQTLCALMGRLMFAIKQSSTQDNPTSEAGDMSTLHTTGSSQS